jgi:hypothetical protein
MTNDVTIHGYPPIVTSNGIPTPTYDHERWLRRSRQLGRRHPLDPHGVCMVCGDHKLGYWEWVSTEPND